MESARWSTHVTMMMQHGISKMVLM
jgi:hypothetical protein